MTVDEMRVGEMRMVGEFDVRRLCEIAQAVGVSVRVEVKDGGEERVFLELREARDVYRLDLMTNDGREICKYGSGEPTSHVTATRAQWALLKRNFKRLESVYKALVPVMS